MYLSIHGYGYIYMYIQSKDLVYQDLHSFHVMHACTHAHVHAF